jgi:hypothetical protein
MSHSACTLPRRRGADALACRLHLPGQPATAGDMALVADDFSTPRPDLATRDWQRSSAAPSNTARHS